MRRVLILGGTRDAFDLAARFRSSPVIRTISSLAGRTRDPRLPPGEVRVGGFGGVAGLEAFLREGAIDAVVDATHPFAARMTAHAVEACAAAGVPRLALVRPPWIARDRDRWLDAPDLTAAAALARSVGRRIFLTTGRSGLEAVTAMDDRWFLIRSVDAPATPLPAHAESVIGRGPFSYGDERALFERHAIDAIVAKNSGGPLTSAKLDVARDLGLPVVMIARPAEPAGPLARDVTSAVAWIATSRDGMQVMR